MAEEQTATPVRRRQRRPAGTTASRRAATTTTRRRRLAGPELVETLNQMVSELIKENRRLKRQLDKLTAKGTKAASGVIEKGLRSLQRRVQRAVGTAASTRTRRRRTAAASTGTGRRRRTTTSARSSTRS